VSGGSKRGWTTWTTAAVDKRVVAIVPAVIDLLNMVKSFDHHYRVYGFFAPSIKDYEEAGVMDLQDTPEYRKLMEIEEPYSYRDRLTMPKFLINAAGDQFFLPDSSRYYFDDLKGEKYIRYVPNADHSLKNSDALQSSLAFYQAFLTNTPRPQFSWTFEADGAIRVVSKDKPSSVKLWQATNPDARDFRLQTIGPAYTSEDLQAGANGVYLGRVTKPGKGFTAYFVEMT
jgi:PhoPQ-activated pathogenicity-related protein